MEKAVGKSSWKKQLEKAVGNISWKHWLQTLSGNLSLQPQLATLVETSVETQAGYICAGNTGHDKESTSERAPRVRSSSAVSRLRNTGLLIHRLLARTGFEPATTAGSFFPCYRYAFANIIAAVLKFLHLLLLTPARPRLRYWSAMALFALIVIIGSIPGARADAAEVASGVVLHSCAYAVLAFLVFTGSSGTPSQRAPKAVLTIAAMGFIDELVQSFLPYRHGAVGDWLVDCTAAIVTSTVLWALWTSRRVST